MAHLSIVETTEKKMYIRLILTDEWAGGLKKIKWQV